MRTEEGKLYLFVAIDRTSKFAFVELHEKATTKVAAEFLRHLIAAVPYKIHTVLTDNGIHFTIPGGGGLTVGEIKEAIASGALFRAHAFELACARNDIDHRLTKPKHPWTNGQVERMNRTIKEATVQRFYYESHQQLRQHLADFVAAYNFGRRLKTLKGLTPFEYICKSWTSQPERFILNPLQQMPGLNSFVDENEACRVEVELPLKPYLSPLQNVGTLLLGRVRRLFLSVIRRRSKKRHSVPMPTPTPFSASAVLISRSVMSGVSSTSDRIIAA